MFNEIDKLCSKNKPRANELLAILKEESEKLSIQDFIKATNIIRSEGVYLRKEYQEDYAIAYLKYFVLRIKDIKKDEKNYSDFLNIEELKEALDLLKYQKEIAFDPNLDPEAPEPGSTKYYERISFRKIYEIICIYTTFILKEPIHYVGMKFPGGYEVKYENNNYFCPVKRNNEDNKKAVCKFCLALQDEDVYS